MRVFNEKIISGVTMNADINSTVMSLYQVFGYAIQAVYTGTPTGTLKLQASCDPVPQVQQQAFTPTNWTDISSSSISISAAGDYMWNVTDVFYNYVRVVYTDGSSGSSTAVLNVVFNAKGF